MSSFEDFKRCMMVEANLDLEAIDVAFLGDATKSLLTKITAGVGAAALTAFIAKVLGTTASGLALAFSEAMGAIIVGIGLGLFFAAVATCKLREVETVII
jgi:hypothetical protein